MAKPILDPNIGLMALRASPMQRRLLVKCSDELLDAMQAHPELREHFAQDVRKIGSSNPSPLNYVGSLVYAPPPPTAARLLEGGLNIPVLPKEYHFSIQEVWSYEDVVFVDRELI